MAWKTISSASGYQLYYPVGNGSYKNIYTASSTQKNVLVYSLKRKNIWI